MLKILLLTIDTDIKDKFRHLCYLAFLLFLFEILIEINIDSLYVNNKNRKIKKDKWNFVKICESNSWPY